MLLLGIDLGTSSVKVSVVDSSNGKCVATAHYPESEASIIAPQPGWAEQSPDTWWEHVQLAILKLHALRKYDPSSIAAIGISYQMHGLVLVDKEQRSIRNSIIWCDSRSVRIGEKAFDEIGHEKCLLHLLNSPGNFTAAKLAWVKSNEPGIYKKIDKVMLPGDFISMKLTGNATTSVSALSEGIFWDFSQQTLSQDIFSYWGFDKKIIPGIHDVFSVHGNLSKENAAHLSLKPGIPVTYKAGDQPNNALSLNVMKPGEVATTAGTSGVIYGISDQLTYDEQSRVNSFAHVNHTIEKRRIGVLLCINGTGILNRWVKNISGNGLSYEEVNEIAAQTSPGSNGLLMLPFGNGAERILSNRSIGAHLHGLDLNLHTRSHLFRAAQEGIAYAFRYGLDIMKGTGIDPAVIRAGKSNMFQSEVFIDSFVNTLGIPVELYDTDGSRGAAIGAGMGAKIFSGTKEAFKNFQPLRSIEPTGKKMYSELYEQWLEVLEKQLN